MILETFIKNRFEKFLKALPLPDGWRLEVIRWQDEREVLALAWEHPEHSLQARLTYLEINQAVSWVALLSPAVDRMRLKGQTVEWIAQQIALAILESSEFSRPIVELVDSYAWEGVRQVGEIEFKNLVNAQMEKIKPGGSELDAGGWAAARGRVMGLIGMGLLNESEEKTIIDWQTCPHWRRREQPIPTNEPLFIREEEAGSPSESITFETFVYCLDCGAVSYDKEKTWRAPGTTAAD